MLVERIITWLHITSQKNQYALVAKGIKSSKNRFGKTIGNSPMISNPRMGASPTVMKTVIGGLMLVISIGNLWVLVASRPKNVSVLIAMVQVSRLKRLNWLMLSANWSASNGERVRQVVGGLLWRQL